MIIDLLVGVLLLTLIGFFLGLFLSFISNIFSIKIDPVVEKITELLPGVNCGACGYPGCAGYADALAKNTNIEINLCSPGGKSLVEKLNLLLGKNSDFSDKIVAKVFCMGDDAIASKDYNFNGEDDCLTMANFFQGEKTCKYSCEGKGDCIKACPVEAIKRDSLNRVWIDSGLCVGCKRCVSVCPKNIIKMVPVNGGYFVACSSHNDGKTVREICKKGCIACKICEKLTGDPTRIVVTNNLAEIKYTNTIDLKSAAIKCPTSVIIPIIDQKVFVIDTLNKDLQKKV